MLDFEFRFTFDQKFRVVHYSATNPVHSHPKSAGLRTAVRQGILDGIRSSGRVPFEISPCATSSESGVRHYHDLRDLHHKFLDNKPIKSSVIVLIDVDYYIDMPKLLIADLPVIMYTFAPKTFSGNTEEAEWWVENKEIQYQVRGGAKYHHKLWDYDTDYLSVVDSYGSLHSYSVTAQVLPDDPNRRVIWIVPTAVIPSPFWKNGSLERNLRALKYRNLDALLRSRDVTDKPVVSIPVGFSSPVVLPEQLYISLQERAKNSKELTIGGINYQLTQAGVKDAFLIAPLLVAELSKVRPSEKISDTAKVRWTNRNQVSFASPADSLERHKPYLKPSIQAVVSDPALAPVLGKAIEEEAVKQRVVKHKNKIKFNTQLRALRDEFLKLIIPKVHLVPLSMEEVFDRLKTPAKRAKALKTLGCLTFLFNEQFLAHLKGEAYAAPSGPRIIMNLDYQHNLVIACWAIPLAEYLKTFDWWAPGKSPEDVAQHIQDMCGAPGAGLTTEADYIKFDLSQSEDMDTSFITFTTSSFPESQLLRDRLMYESTAGGKTRNGTHIEAGSYNDTGSWFTTSRNGFINAMLIYMGYRLQGLTPEQAFKRIGITFGDDILTPYLPELEQVCSMVGVGVKIRHARTGLEFLSRIFPDPSASTSSYAKPVRALSKIHLTKEGTPEELANKAFGYFVTDLQTPVLSDLVRAILRVADPKEETMTHEDKYKGEHPWPQDDKDLIYDHMMSSGVLDPGEATEFIKCCGEVKTFQDLNSLPCLTTLRKPATIDWIDNFGQLFRVEDETVASNKETKDKKETKDSPKEKQPKDNSKQKPKHPLDNLPIATKPTVITNGPSNPKSESTTASSLPDGGSQCSLVGDWEGSCKPSSSGSSGTGQEGDGEAVAILGTTDVQPNASSTIPVTDVSSTSKKKRKRGSKKKKKSKGKGPGNDTRIPDVSNC
jgi:hypothetical protein